MVQLLLLYSLATAPVTVALNLSPGSSATVEGTIDGKPAKFAVELGSPDSVVFGPDSANGATKTSKVKIGGFDIGPVDVGAASDELENFVSISGLAAYLGYGAFKGCQLGFDLKAGTLTLWRGATHAVLQAWAGNEGKLAGSLPYESRADSPIVASIKVGAHPAKVWLTTGADVSAFTPKLFAELKPSDSTLGPIESKLVRFAFPGGQTPGWSWCMSAPPKAVEALAAQNVGGRLDVRWLGIERLAVDTTTRTLWFPSPSKLQRFATWIAMTTHIPAAALGGKVVFNHSLSFAATIVLPPDTPPLPPDIELRSIAGIDVEKLRAAFDSSDAASGQMLADLPNRTLGHSYDIILGLDGNETTVTIDPP